MDSRLRLNILDKQIDRDYASQRSTEIIQASIILVVIRVIKCIAVLINELHNSKFRIADTIFRTISIILQLIVIFINKRYPQ